MLFQTGEDYAYTEDIFRSLQAHGQRLRVVIEDAAEMSRRALCARKLAANRGEAIPQLHRARYIGHEKDDAPLIHYLGGSIEERTEWGQHKDEDIFASVWNDHRPLPATMRAIGLTGAKLDAFAVCSRSFAVSWCSLLQPWGVVQLMPNFDGLSSLHLGPEDCTRTDDPAARACEVDAFVEMLQQLAPNLKELSLHGVYPTDDSWQKAYSRQISEVTDRHIFPNMSFPKLEEFALQHFNARYSTFVQFLVRHAECLRRPDSTGHLWECPPCTDDDKENLCEELERAGFAAQVRLADCFLRFNERVCPWL